MSDKQGFTDSVSRFGQWLSRPFGQLKTDIRELRTESRRKREAKERRRDEVRSKNRMRRNILGRTLAGMVIFTALYWGAYFLVQLVPALYSLVEALAVGLFLMFPGNQYVADMPAYLLLIYVVVMVIWPVAALHKTAGYLDSVYTAADGLLDREKDMPELPARIGDLDMKLRGIRLAVAENEQLAREAEQRKNDLVVYLAHDLKTPLASVIGYLTLLAEAPELPPEQRAKYTSITLDKAYRLEQLINEFFDITRFSLQTTEPEHNRIDLSLMLMQLADEFYPVLEEKNLTVRLTVPPKLMMTGDADKLMRVFDNLLRNAACYSYEHTDILLTARHRDADHVEITCRNKGDRIPPQSLERLFEKFFRLDSARHSGTGGSGLGLAIARQIVELHGGTISAESTEEYTTFRILLPIRQTVSSPSEIVRKS